jgi:phenylalanyl-tRNA synthetase alpha chain
VDWEQYRTDAEQAIAAARDAASLDDARVRYLGRKSDLAQALRGVRDRESGMLLNGIRTRLEAAVEERREAIESEELERLYAESSFDVTLPGRGVPARAAARADQVKREIEDVFLGMGFEVYEGPRSPTRGTTSTRSRPIRGTRRARRPTPSTSRTRCCCARTRPRIRSA